MRAMTEQSGSVLGFMREELGFTDAMQAALRKAVLEPVETVGAVSSGTSKL